MSKKDELTKKQQHAIGNAGALIEEALDSLEEAGVSTREFALVRTKLEEADMWYDRALEAIGYRYPEHDEEQDEYEEGDEDEDGSEDEDDNSKSGKGK